MGHPAWNLALNALDWSLKQPDIDDRNYRWKYFSLVKPPADSISNGKDGLYNDLNKYEDVQRRIQDLVDLTINDIGKADSFEYIKGLVIQELRDLRNQSIRTEKSLLAEILGESDLVDNYDLLADMTTPDIGPNDKSTIRLWTELTLFGQPENMEEINWQHIGYRTAFSLFVGSVEFSSYFKVRKKPLIDKILSEINAYILSGKGSRNPIEDVVENYLNQIMKEIGKAFINSPKIGNQYADMIVAAIGESMKDSRYITVKRGTTPSSYLLTFFHIPKTEYESFLTTAYPKINDIVKKMNKDKKIVQPIILELQTDPSSDTKKFYIAGAGNSILNTQPDLPAGALGSGKIETELIHIIINNVIKQMAYALESLKGRRSINCLSLGEIDFGNSTRNYEDCLGMALDYLQGRAGKDSGSFADNLKQRVQRNTSLWKSFYAQKTDDFFNGLFGEIIGLVNFSSLMGRADYKTHLTGGVVAQANKKKVGGLVNDLIFSKDIRRKNEDGSKGKRISYVRHGVNVKHYVRQKGSIFKLYGNSGKNGIFTSYTAKYLSAAQLNLVRFILANSQYFMASAMGKTISIEDIIMNVAIFAIPQYLRISDRTRKSASNLFFQINNVVYPTSYIYTCALEQIDYLGGYVYEKNNNNHGCNGWDWKSISNLII